MTLKHKTILPFLCLVMGIMFFSCSNDEDFSTGNIKNISFSEDTLKLDTIFSNIGSSTKWLKVFNNDSKGIRINSIRLSSGGNSGYRINVDGQAGTYFKDTEINHKDSIFIFVELTAPTQGKMMPQYIGDSIIFSLQDGKSKIVVLEAYAVDAIRLDAPVISVDTEYDSTKNYIIYDSLVVNNGATLTLKEGTHLYFHSGAGMVINGTLKSEGTEKHPVVLRGDRLDRMFDYLPYDRLTSQWKGVKIGEKSYNNTLNYTDLHSSSFGIICEGKDTTSYKLWMENSVIHNVAGNGIQTKGCKIFVANSQISNAKESCVNIYGGSSCFIHTTIAQFYPWTEHSEALSISNSDEMALDNASFYNCFITGNNSDDLMGYQGSETKAFNYIFDHCVINTPIDSTNHQLVNCKKDTLSDRSKNFKKVDWDNFIYDFRLDSISPARNYANDKFISSYPKDMNGVARKSGSVDAGAYQTKE